MLAEFEAECLGKSTSENSVLREMLNRLGDNVDWPIFVQQSGLHPSDKTFSQMLPVRQPRESSLFPSAGVSPSIVKVSELEYGKLFS